MPRPYILTAEEVAKRFSPKQIAMWPKGYRPTAEVAKYLSLGSAKGSSNNASPATLARLIAAKASLASQSAKAAAAGSDDGSIAAIAHQPVLASSVTSPSQHSYSVVSKSPLSVELPFNERAHLEAAFLDFMSGNDEAWLSQRYNISDQPDEKLSTTPNRLPRLPWPQMSVGRRKRALKRITARNRPLPQYLEVCELLNLPPPYKVADFQKWRPSPAGLSSPTPTEDASATEEEQLTRYLASIPESLPCDIEITDYKTRGNRLSPAAGTVGVQMGRNASEGPKAVPIAPVRPGVAMVGTYRHSVETAVKLYEREVSRSSRKGSSASSGSEQLPPRFYDFTPYAAQQEHALLPISRCTSLDDPVALPTYEAFRNVLQMDYLNTFGVANYLSSITGDGLVLTQEFVTELAMYLAKRWNEIAATEAATHAKQTASSSSAGVPDNATQSTSVKPPGPIVLPFGNGRLAYYLNETGLIPTRVYATSRFSAKLLYPQPLSVLSEDSSLLYGFPSTSFFNTSTVPDKKIIARTLEGVGEVAGGEDKGNFSTNTAGSTDFASLPNEDFLNARYPIHTEVAVHDALKVYQPSMVVAEPHTSRDYGSDLRGCASVKEVIFIGPVDGPAMGSFSFPWLTFGVTPSSDTYQLYNEQFQMQGKGSAGGGGGMLGASRSMQMPMDPPYMAQGYQRVYLDRISALTIMPNDSAEVPRQGRCLAFRRV